MFLLMLSLSLFEQKESTLNIKTSNLLLFLGYRSF